MKIIEELWYEHLQESKRPSAEKRRFRSLFCEYEEEIRTTLNEKQKKLLDRYENALISTFADEEFECFKRGVSFAIRLIAEALCEE